jgi:NTE family protein
MPIGIVLSGGGAKGDFELGALRAMYNRGIRPAVLAGTSVGSINAVKLAEDPTSDEPLTELEAIWFGLVTDDDMYVEDPNFKKVNQAIKNFVRYNWFTIGYELFTVATSGLLGLIGDFGDAIRLGIDATNLVEGLVAFFNSGAKSMYLLDPIRQKLAARLDPGRVSRSGAVLRMATVSLETGKVRYVDQSGRFIDDGTAVDLISATIASASIPAIFAPQPLGSENFIDGGVRDVLPIQAALDAGADQVFAVTASRAGVDPVASFNGKTILDIAMRGAADIMSDQIQSFETNPPVQSWPSNVLIIQPDFTVHDSFTIDNGLIRINSGYGYMRAAELVDFARSSNPGDILRLVFLAILSTSIARLRLDIWTLEYGAAGQRTPQQTVTDPQLVLVPSPELFLQVREKKRQLKELVEERVGLYGTSPGMVVEQTTLNFGEVPVCAQVTQFITIKNMADGGMPTNFSALWLEFEAHPWINLAAASPWSSFVSQAGNVPAAMPPPPTVLIEDLQFSLTLPFGSFSVSSISALSVPPGGSAAIAITMGSPQAQVGTTQATLTIASNDPNNLAMQVQLIGRFVQAPPTIGAPASKNFGVVLFDQSRTSIIIIRNDGCQDMIVSQLDVMDDVLGAFGVGGPLLPLSVASRGSAQIQLTFTPPGDGLFTGTLSIVSTNAQPLVATVNLRGTGRGPINRASTTDRIPASLASVLTAAQIGRRKLQPAGLVGMDQTTIAQSRTTAKPAAARKRSLKRNTRGRK